MRQLYSILLAIVLLTGCTTPDRNHNWKRWPSASEVSAIAEFGRAANWNDEKCGLYRSLWQCPEEIRRLNPLDVTITSSAVIMTIQDDDDTWSGLLVPYTSYTVPKDWVVVGAKSGALRVQVRTESPADREPRFSKDCFVAGGRLTLDGKDGREFGSGANFYDGPLTTGRHSFLLTWRASDEHYRYFATRWLEVEITKGHYRLTAKKNGHCIEFIAVVGSSRKVVAAAPPAPIEREPRMPGEPETYGLEEIQGF